MRRAGALRSHRRYWTSTKRLYLFEEYQRFSSVSPSQPYGIRAIGVVESWSTECPFSSPQASNIHERIEIGARLVETFASVVSQYTTSGKQVNITFGMRPEAFPPQSSLLRSCILHWIFALRGPTLQTALDFNFKIFAIRSPCSSLFIGPSYSQ
jgi:hypothetical protein